MASGNNASRKQNLAALQAANVTRSDGKLAKKKRVAYFHALGYSQAEIAEKLGVSLDAVEIYVKELRGEFLKELASVPLQDFIATLMLSIGQRKRRAQNLYASTTNDAVKLGALKLIAEEDDRVVKFLQSLGAVYKAPERISLDDEFENELKELFKNEPGVVARLFALLEPADGKPSNGRGGDMAKGQTGPN